MKSATKKKYPLFLTKLLALLNPETLETSRVLKILKEDLSFSIKDLKEITKSSNIYENTEDLIDALFSIKFIELTNENTQAKYSLKSNQSVIHLINVPSNVSKEELLNDFQLNDEDIERIYKDSIFWIIVVDSEKITEELKNALKNKKFESQSLHFEIQELDALVNQIKKRIHNLIYLKEADNLKGSPEKSGHKLSTQSKESGSWRKRSDLSNTE